MTVLLTGGRLVDPAQGIDGVRDVLIEGNKIQTVSQEPLSPELAEKVLELRGFCIAPGFIDAHMHEDPIRDGKLFKDPDKAIFARMLRQGVTTCIAGNCGDNAAEPKDYLDRVDAEGSFVNVAMLAGEGFFREKAGQNDRYAPLTQEQLRHTALKIGENLDAGACGVSFGIRYYPGIDKTELDACCREAAVRNKISAAHLRDDAANVFRAADEFLESACANGGKAQISHVGSMAGFGQMERFLEITEERRRGGEDVTLDCYPYDAFSTSIGSCTYDGDWTKRYGCGYDAVELCEGKYKGQRCTEDIFEEERRLHPGYLTVCHVMRPEEIVKAYGKPFVMCASDGILSSGDGHPRASSAIPNLSSRKRKAAV